jgi:FkbM family methyltransferase
MKSNDFNLDKKIQIEFEGMPYWVMPRYRRHYVEKSYERFSLKLLGNFLDEHSTFLDVGAHYGAYSLYAAKNCGSSVIAVEPVNENYQLLTENIKENHLSMLISTHNVAASDTEGEAEFNIPWASDSAGFYEHPLAETIKKQKVKVKKIDSIVKNKKIDFIKIDTEGHELSVIGGLRNTLASNPSVKLLIEANPQCLKSAGNTVHELLSVLVKEYDKEVYIVSEEKFMLFRITDRIDQWNKYISENGYANILCLPKKDHHYAVFVCHSSEPGGAGLAMVEHIERLRERGILSHVIIPNEGGIESNLINKGIGYSVVKYRFWVRNNMSNEQVAEMNQLNMEASTLIANVAQDVNPTIIVNNSMVCAWGYPVANAMQLPLIWFIHEFGDIDHGFEFVHDIQNVRDFIVSNSDIVITCSEAVKRVMLDAKKRPNVHVVYSGIESSRINELAKEKIGRVYSSESKLKLCFVGRVSQSKGQIYAIRALAELKKKGLSVELLLVGPADTDYKNVISQEIQSLDLSEYIKILGYHENPFPFVEQSDAVLVCSDNEAFGRVTTEAMTLGKVVIGSDKGGTAEIIHDGYSGLLFKSKNVKDLADKIEKIYKDSQLRKKLSENAQVSILKFMDNKKNGDQLAELFMQATKPKNRRTHKLINTEWIDCVNLNMQKRNQLQSSLQQKEASLQKAQQLAISREAERNKLAKQHHDILNSRSWKLTTPMRKAGKLARIVKQKINTKI